MHTVEEFIEQIHAFSAQDRKRLLKHLQSLIEEEAKIPPSASKGPYSHSLALAGTVQAKFTDVSTDKYTHLAAAYADQHEDR